MGGGDGVGRLFVEKFCLLGQMPNKDGLVAGQRFLVIEQFKKSRSRFLTTDCGFFGDCTDQQKLIFLITRAIRLHLCNPWFNFPRFRMAIAQMKPLQRVLAVPLAAVFRFITPECTSRGGK
ncbi:hypothetical protein OPIT5_06835 [Opitutaceae bacterium TAV5]|nr:hypothetical protein OPIT5_06835 [Opitutaceae bacterium TAV5]